MTQFLFISLTVRKQGFWHWNYAGLCVVTYAVLFSVDGGGTCVLTVHEWTRHTCHFQVECLYFWMERDLIHQKSTFPKPTFLPPSPRPTSGKNNPITFVSLDQVPGIVCLYTLSHTRPFMGPCSDGSVSSVWSLNSPPEEAFQCRESSMQSLPSASFRPARTRNIWKASSESAV